MKLAFSSLACPDWTIERTVEGAVEYGYEGIEWRLADGELISPSLDDAVVERLRKASGHPEVAVCCLDSSVAFIKSTAEEREAAIAESLWISQLAADMGTRFVRVYGGRIPAGGSRDALIGPAREALTRAAADASALGVTLAVEMHDEWSLSPDVLELIEGTGAEVIWDILHPFRLYEMPADTVAALGDHCVHVHVKDALRDDSEEDGTKLVLMGEGDVPVAECLQLLEGRGYADWLSFEWEKKWVPELDEPEVALPHAAAYLRRMVSAPA